jgi:nondiscriminating aspartyl-tRNA synthetase
VAKAPTVNYEESLKIVNREAEQSGNSKLASSGGASARIFDINPEAERLISDWSLREHGVDLVFVNEFPRRHRPFYTYPLEAPAGASAKAGGEGAAPSQGGPPSGGGLTMSFDAIFRGLEITSGSRRQHDYNAVVETLPKFGIKPESMTGYLQVLKYGSPPHGGFAIGLERLTQKILGLANVKEASLFPRDRKRVEP